MYQGESSRMLRVAAGAEKCSPFGSHLYSRRSPGEMRCGGTCQRPCAGPAIHCGGHLTTVTRSVEPVAPKPLAPWRPRNPPPAAARRSRASADSLRIAAPLRIPSSREGRRPAPGSSLAVVRPPPSRVAPPSQPRQIPESLGPLRHPGGF